MQAQVWTRRHGTHMVTSVVALPMSAGSEPVSCAFCDTSKVVSAERPGNMPLGTVPTRLLLVTSLCGPQHGATATRQTRQSCEKPGHRCGSLVAAIGGRYAHGRDAIKRAADAGPITGICHATPPAVSRPATAARGVVCGHMRRHPS